MNPKQQKTAEVRRNINLYEEVKVIKRDQDAQIQRDSGQVRIRAVVRRDREHAV